ncbi:hypothetical protein [Neobacillus bataviensis]|uniref:hypothetical protein n=1 Tax=Neobacillus bataviensis TaxID=220685 RepID=UPI001CBCA73A|nr:hypothetical protein [Neobacillus bataviensis]
MNVHLLQWGLFTFMLGIVLSLPVAAVHYQRNTPMTKLFTNARKLKSAHLDYFMQAFALGFAYILELALKTEFSLYVVIPLVFGAIMNPTILLLEATSIIRSGLGKVIYTILRSTSPIALLFAWFAIAFLILPLFLKITLIAVIISMGIVFFTFQKRSKKTIINDLNTSS